MSEPAPVRAVSPKTLEGPDPFLVDLGKHKRKDIKQLCDGSGPLVGEVASCLRELRESGQIAADAQPVVIVVRERKRKSVFWRMG